MINKLALLGIGGYQRWLSPYKGYRCAYSVAHGGTGCSGYVKAVIAEQGMWSGLPKIRARFRACKATAMAMNEENSRQTELNRKGRRWRDELKECACLGCLSVPVCAGGASGDPVDTVPTAAADASSACSPPAACDAAPGCDIAPSCDCGGCGW